VIDRKTIRQVSHSVFQKFLQEHNLKIRSLHTRNVLSEIFCDIVPHKHVYS